VFGLAFGLWGLSIGVRPLDDNSFFTHLATGRLIVDSGVPSADPYSFTAPGEPWVVQSWLVSAAFGLAEKVLGSAGPHLVVTLLTTALGLLVWTLTRPAGSLLPRIGLAGLVLGVGEGLWTERPLLVGLVGLALVLLAAEDRLDPRWLVPVMWVWVNSHGSFPFAVVALLCLAAGRRLDGERPATELRALWWTLGGIALGAIGPLGPKALLFPLNFLSNSDVFQNITEWQSPSFTSAWARLFLVQIAVTILALARRPRFRSAVPAVVFLVGALVALRNIPAASLVLVPGTAAALAGLGSLTGDRRSPATAVGAIAIVVVGAVLAVAGLGGTTYNLDGYPVAATAWAAEHDLALEDRRAAAPDFVGNWLEGRSGDEAAVFVDDRYDMYPPEVAEAYLDLLRARPGWRAALDEYGVDTVLWETSQPLAEVLAADEDWRIVFWGEGWLVACRRGSDDCD
jgi:hypothetical protein